MFLARPYLRLHLMLYTRRMSTGAFAGEDHDKTVPGADPDRLLFIGDIGVAGYGVLLPGMAMPAQVAALHAAHTRRGGAWETISAFDMTAERAAAAVIGSPAQGIDVAVIALGVPDVLMITSPDQWTIHLTAIIASVRVAAGEQCRVVLTGIPSMDRFEPISPLARKLISAQVGRLDAATEEVASTTANVVWAPFPDLTSGRVYIQNAFSFRAMHAIWAEAIAPHLSSPRN